MEAGSKRELNVQEVERSQALLPLPIRKGSTVTSCGCSKFLPQLVSSQAANDVKVKNCSPGFVAKAK